MAFQIVAGGGDRSQAGRQVTLTSQVMRHTGGRVVVTYNKAYDFAEADGHHFSGSVRSGLWLEKSDNRWLITGEKDL